MYHLPSPRPSYPSSLKRPRLTRLHLRESLVNQTCIYRHYLLSISTTSHICIKCPYYFIFLTRSPSVFPPCSFSCPFDSPLPSLVLFISWFVSWELDPVRQLNQQKYRQIHEETKAGMLPINPTFYSGTLGFICMNTSYSRMSVEFE